MGTRIAVNLTVSHQQRPEQWPEFATLEQWPDYVTKVASDAVDTVTSV